MRTSGWVVCASILLVLAGVFSIINGLIAIFDDEVFLVGSDSLVGLNFTGWGIVHLVVGGIVLAAGLAVTSGHLWARVVGVLAAMISAVSQIGFITAFPFWAVTIIALDVLILYGLVIHGEEVEGRLRSSARRPEEVR